MRKEIKDRINKRKIAYIYLLHRMFEGNPTKLIRTMQIKGLTAADLEDWNKDFKDAVYKVIEEEDANGVKLREKEDVPSIKSIKEKVLRRCFSLIEETTDPSKLATVYKILSEFEVTEEKKEKTVLDAINDSIKPLYGGKKKDKVTMLERMKQAKFDHRVPEGDADTEEPETEEDE